MLNEILLYLKINYRLKIIRNNNILKVLYVTNKEKLMKYFILISRIDRNYKYIKKLVDNKIFNNFIIAVILIQAPALTLNFFIV